jgi:hypothetical protein
MDTNTDLSAAGKFRCFTQSKTVFKTADQSGVMNNLLLIRW